MIPNKYLRMASTLLKSKYCFLTGENILAVAEDKQSAPYAYVLTDEKIPNTILVSFAVDYPNASDAAQIVLDLRKISAVAMVEDFYLAKNGQKYWGEEAFKYYTFDTQLPLEELQPRSEERH